MKAALGSSERLIWAFWVAASLAAIGGIVPFVFSGSSGRANGVLIPYLVAAVAFGACAALHRQGRMTISILYFVAGLAVIFGLLSMFSLPLRLAVLGTCPALPAPCASGLERPLTDAENTGIGVSSAFGIVALLFGFFGLATLYRRTVVPPSTPPARKIPPMPPTPEPTKAPEPEVEAKVEAKAEPEEEPELPAHEEEERPELPAHESTPPTT